MSVVQFPRRKAQFSILDGAPKRSASSSFMGFLETVAWVAFRDEQVSLAARWHSLDRPDIDAHWIGAAMLMLANDASAHGLSIWDVASEVTDKCSSGLLQGKGRGIDGFHDIPENDWLGARFVAQGNNPDTILTAGHSGKGWTHVQFKRADVVTLWPALKQELETTWPTHSETNKRPGWYPLLRQMMEDADKLLRNKAEQNPDRHPPLFPTAAKFRQRLLAIKGIGESDVRPSTVRYHVRNIKDELGR